MSPTPLLPPERMEFASRVVRVLALVTLAYASLQLLQYVLYLAIQGLWWSFARDQLRIFDRAAQLSRFGLVLLLLGGSIGLLKWKPWGRPAVMWWAGLFVAMNFAIQAIWTAQYARDVAAAVATTQRAVYQPVWQFVLGQALSWLGDAFFPLLVWLVLRQPEAAKLFERMPGGGFEVVPYAQAAAVASGDGKSAHSG